MLNFAILAVCLVCSRPVQGAVRIIGVCLDIELDLFSGCCASLPQASLCARESRTPDQRHRGEELPLERHGPN
jgi:hypothetical protein